MAHPVGFILLLDQLDSKIAAFRWSDEQATRAAMSREDWEQSGRPEQVWLVTAEPCIECMQHAHGNQR